MTLYSGQLRLASYNCRGWNNGKSVVSDLLDSHDICVIQEHWLFADHLNELNFNSDFLSVGVSGMDSSVLLYGRPFGGCAIFVRKSLIGSVTTLSTNAKRFSAVRLSDHSGHSFLLVCVYLPTDYGRSSSNDEFLFTLDELEGFVSSQQFDSLLIAGDFYVDFARSCVNTGHLLSLMEDFNLKSVDLRFLSNIDFTYKGPNGSSKSWLDHIFVSHPFEECFTSVQKLDFATNVSDHHPLSCIFDFHACTNFQVPCHSPIQFSPCIAWHKVSESDIQHYCYLISDSLPCLPPDLISCSDPACLVHQSVLDSYCDFLLRCISEAALQALPLVKSSPSLVPGWNNAARLLKSKANFWHRVWCEAGSPSAGVLTQLKKASKRRYKYEVRRLKRRRLLITRNRMASALANSNSRNFWKEVKNINRSSSHNLRVPVVDGVHGDTDIALHFANKLKNLLSSDSAADRDSHLDKIGNKLVSEDLSSVSISITCIRSAFSRLKPHKHDGTNLLSDHLIHAPPAIDTFVAGLFSSIIHHGYMPSVLRNCVLVPIPKGSNDSTSSDNYRPVALAPSLSKALEWCILLNYPDQFMSSDLRFGFKKKHSTTLCTGVVKNVVSRYVHNGSPVLGCFLDASKAFDRVNHDVLFTKLAERGLPATLTRFLLSWYKSQSMHVWWNTFTSPPFLSPMAYVKVMYYHPSFYHLPG